MARLRQWSSTEFPASRKFNRSGQVLASPDPHAGLWCHSELVARLHAESVIPGVHISEDAIDPELLRSVLIRHQ